MKSIKLTTAETAALTAAFHSAQGNGHDFGLTEDVVKALAADHGAQAVGALLTSLQRKGVLTVHGPVTTNAGTRHAATYTQFTWQLSVVRVAELAGIKQPRAKAAAKPKSMYDHAVALQAALAAYQTLLPIDATVTHYSEHVVKVKVDILVAGVPSLTIEYWGNADANWVKANVGANAAAIKDATYQLVAASVRSKTS